LEGDLLLEGEDLREGDDRLESVDRLGEERLGDDFLDGDERLPGEDFRGEDLRLRSGLDLRRASLSGDFFASFLTVGASALASLLSRSMSSSSWFSNSGCVTMVRFIFSCVVLNSILGMPVMGEIWFDCWYKSIEGVMTGV